MCRLQRFTTYHFAQDHEKFDADVRMFHHEIYVSWDGVTTKNQLRNISLDNESLIPEGHEQSR